MGKGFLTPPVQCCCGQATGPLSVTVTVRGQQQDAKSLHTCPCADGWALGGTRVKQAGLHSCLEGGLGVEAGPPHKVKGPHMASASGSSGDWLC